MFYESKKNPFYIALEKSLEYPLHLHQYIEIVHVIQGSLEMQIGASKYRIMPGEFVLCFPNVTHDYHTITPKNETSFCIINSYLELLPLHNKILTIFLPESPCIKASHVHNDVLFAERRLLQIYNSTENEQQELISSLLSLILSHLLPKLSLQDYQTSPQQEMSSKIISYIAHHFSEDLSLSVIANNFGIGKFALSRIFSDVLGINFITYLNSLRINHAQLLLHDTNMNILTIAIECGFHNQQTFNRVFKELCGCTPKEFRHRECGSQILPLIQEEHIYGEFLTTS